jgi:hypothetical protein
MDPWLAMAVALAHHVWGGIASSNQRHTSASCGFEVTFSG